MRFCNALRLLPFIALALSLLVVTNANNRHCLPTQVSTWTTCTDNNGNTDYFLPFIPQIQPPAPRPSLAPGQCPPDDGKIRTVDGVTYLVLCKQAYSTGDHSDTSNMTEHSCMKSCSALANCQGANFNMRNHECERHFTWEGQPSYTVSDKGDWIAYRPILKC
ncbi:unnamed protein product [Penicillium manginii]